MKTIIYAEACCSLCIVKVFLEENSKKLEGWHVKNMNAHLMAAELFNAIEEIGG